MQFQDLKLIDPLLRAVRAEGYDTPTPIQVQAIPGILEGRDIVGCAQTGTGKTAAFALPLLQQLAAKQQKRGVIRVLVLSPTRELAAQIGESFAVYGRQLPFKHQVIFGGVGQNPQVQALQRGTDILVATPGRLLDLMNQGIVRLDTVEHFVLDEADRMLDMGFIHDVRRVVKALPSKRQTLLFSATMPEAIQALANNILHKPLHVEVTPQATTVERIDQCVYFVAKKDKYALLEHLLHDKSIERVLVFTRTKHGANKLVKQLDRASISAEAIHGNKSQSARERALENFKNSRIRVLVATDIASRGLDVENVTHVVNFDLPNEPESYVHRIGRTARAGASGIAISFCDVEERDFLRDIEKLIRLRVPVIKNHPYVHGAASAASADWLSTVATAPIKANPMGQAQAQRSAAPVKAQNAKPQSKPHQQGGERRQQDAATGNATGEAKKPRRRRGGRGRNGGGASAAAAQPRQPEQKQRP